MFSIQRLSVFNVEDTLCQRFSISLSIVIVIFLFQGIGSSLDIESVIDTKKFFYILQSHPLIMRKQMDDDCQRGMFRAYHIVISLMEYQAISLKNQGKYFKCRVRPKDNFERPYLCK